MQAGVFRWASAVPEQRFGVCQPCQLWVHLKKNRRGSLWHGGGLCSGCLWDKAKATSAKWNKNLDCGTTVELMGWNGLAGIYSFALLCSHVAWGQLWQSLTLNCLMNLAESFPISQRKYFVLRNGHHALSIKTMALVRYKGIGCLKQACANKNTGDRIFVVQSQFTTMFCSAHVIGWILAIIFRFTDWKNCICFSKKQNCG